MCLDKNKEAGEEHGMKEISGVEILQCHLGYAGSKVQPFPSDSSVVCHSNPKFLKLAS